MILLTDELFQTYANDDESIRVDILYNNTFDYFYFETYKNDVLIQGATKVVNEYQNQYLRFFSLQGDYATFEAVKSFNLEFLS
jgi:hypothetical protein